MDTMGLSNAFRPLYYVSDLVFTSAITFGLVALMQKIPGLRRIV
jgi:hypothetical protein